MLLMAQISSYLVYQPLDMLFKIAHQGSNFALNFDASLF